MTDMNNKDSVNGELSDYYNALDTLMTDRDKKFSSAETSYDQKALSSIKFYAVVALVEGSFLYTISRFYQKDLVLPQELNPGGKAIPAYSVNRGNGTGRINFLYQHPS